MLHVSSVSSWTGLESCEWDLRVRTSPDTAGAKVEALRHPPATDRKLWNTQHDTTKENIRKWNTLLPGMVNIGHHQDVFSIHRIMREGCCMLQLLNPRTQNSQTWHASNLLPCLLPTVQFLWPRQALLPKSSQINAHAVQPDATSNKKARPAECWEQREHATLRCTLKCCNEMYWKVSSNCFLVLVSKMYMHGPQGIVPIFERLDRFNFAFDPGICTLQFAVWILDYWAAGMHPSISKYIKIQCVYIYIVPPKIAEAVSCFAHLCTLEYFVITRKLC